MILRIKYLDAILALGFLFLPIRLTHAQTVQLPTTRQFWSSGAVLVPDRGGASMAGMGGRSAHGSARSVPLLGRSGFRPSVTNGHRGSSVHATVIDLKEIDREVLAGAKRRPVSALSSQQKRARFIAQNVFRRRPYKANVESQNTADSSKANERIAVMIKKAKQAELDGKPKIAQMFYRAAAQTRPDRRRR